MTRCSRRIDGRVRDLGEALLEERKQEARLFRQTGKGGVIAHGPDRLDASAMGPMMN
jgi:hypothetical protein